MCGIAGFFSLHQYKEDFYIDHIKKMINSLSHRGPDDSGFWVDVKQKIVLGHRRLSILDLKPTGHQPMESSQGRFVIIYNGEIYNYLDLKQQLDEEIATKWRGHSDTEILLRGFEHWGIKNTLDKACGMFAFAVFDKQTKKLVLARDRIGQKPLYYGWFQDIFFFGSELKILTSAVKDRPEIDMKALDAYFRYGYIPAPYCIFQNFAKILPGSYVEINTNKFTPATTIIANKYWQAKDYFTSQYKNTLSIFEAQNKLEEILEQVLKQTVLSDVPVGAFLSGGIDSSLVVALMQKINSGKTKTFTIGFHENEFNEADHALKVAQHLNTDHTEFYFPSQKALDIIPKLPQIYDEPFADMSQLPTILVSSLARSKVTVALSGDGGDELFAGYRRYKMAKLLLNFRGLLPTGVNKILSKIILSMPNLSDYDNYILKKLGITKFWHLGRRAAKVLTSSSDKIYESIISMHPLDEELLQKGLWNDNMQNIHNLQDFDSINKMMYADMMSYLPDDIMVKVDRAAMSVSLETRAPLLDRRVMELSLIHI